MDTGWGATPWPEAPTRVPRRSSTSGCTSLVKYGLIACHSLRQQLTLLGQEVTAPRHVRGGVPVDVAFVIRRRLDEFGLEQRDLAHAAQVTESYISQLLTGRRAPPAPNRTDIYDKMDSFLKLPTEGLTRLAGDQRHNPF